MIFSIDRGPVEVVKTSKVSRRVPGGVKQVSTIGQIRFFCDQSSRIGELTEGSNDGIGRVNFGEVGSPLMVYRFFMCFPSTKPASTPVPRMTPPNHHVASSGIASDWHFQATTAAISRALICVILDIEAASSLTKSSYWVRITTRCPTVPGPTTTR